MYSTSVFIGAPKANSSQLPTVNEPGTISKCAIVNGKPSNCAAFEVDSKFAMMLFFNLKLFLNTD